MAGLEGMARTAVVAVKGGLEEVGDVVIRVDKFLRKARAFPLNILDETRSHRKKRNI
jgi:hypothetical protein